MIPFDHPFFPWDKNPKIPGYRGQPDRFCNAQGEPEVSDDACGIAGLTVGAVHLLLNLKIQLHTPKKNLN